jgi:hypothetical protein
VTLQHYRSTKKSSPGKLHNPAALAGAIIDGFLQRKGIFRRSICLCTVGPGIANGMGRGSAALGQCKEKKYRCDLSSCLFASTHHDFPARQQTAPPSLVSIPFEDRLRTRGILCQSRLA